MIRMSALCASVVFVADAEPLIAGPDVLRREESAKKGSAFLPKNVSVSNQNSDGQTFANIVKTVCSGVGVDGRFNNDDAVAAKHGSSPLAGKAKPWSRINWLVKPIIIAIEQQIFCWGAAFICQFKAQNGLVLIAPNEPTFLNFDVSPGFNLEGLTQGFVGFQGEAVSLINSFESQIKNGGSDDSKDHHHPLSNGVFRLDKSRVEPVPPFLPTFAVVASVLAAAWFVSIWLGRRLYPPIYGKKKK